MNDKKYYWLKLKENFFTDKEIKKLRRIAGGDTYTIIYLKLQLLSLKKSGKLIFDGIEDSFHEELALEIDEDSTNVEITINFLLKCGLMEYSTENELILPQTMECIGREGASAERMRRLRENQNKIPSLCDTIVQTCDTEIEIEKEKELEKEKEKREKKKEKAKVALLPDVSSYSQDFIKTLENFLEHRKKIKRPLTENALKLIIKKLKYYEAEESKQIMILENSILNGWSGVFALKDLNKNQAKNVPNSKNFEQRKYDESYLDKLYEN